MNEMNRMPSHIEAIFDQMKGDNTIPYVLKISSKNGKKVLSVLEKGNEALLWDIVPSETSDGGKLYVRPKFPDSVIQSVALDKHLFDWSIIWRKYNNKLPMELQALHSFPTKKSNHPTY